MSRFRTNYRPMTSAEVARIDAIKTQADRLDGEFLEASSMSNCDPRAIERARTKLEEAVMWATKAVTA